MTAVVYWLLDAQDNILYVGCTLHLKSRLAHHAQFKAWWPSVTSVAYTLDMAREVALRVEREDIAELQPPHNVADRFGMSGIEIARACYQTAQRAKKAAALIA